jgi:hypothetical protein
MDQYYKIFGTCKIPNKKKDKIKVMQITDVDIKKSNHITVMHKNKVQNIQFVFQYEHFLSIFISKIYSLKIIDPENGKSYSICQIYQSLKDLVKEVNNSQGIGLGILTASEDREMWSDIYSKLSDSNFKQISIFLLAKY